ncbi:MAG TPA: tRNA (adenosine(37)-N6)-threonylcarbamoyltransferase complex transferase subunit TsaD, partial [Desulfotomaculum sp.]|nr:tRNA (adenosine(37)-N6)-threonylcarbamoyltransferase complex transferase subunit TsaD [Desulfotomaculum sp.]
MSVQILSIETSCDDTCASLVVDGTKILSNVVFSQEKVHKIFGGVVPEVASRKHLELINEVVQKALDEAGIDFNSIDAVGVTYGPGLAGALLVGIAAAKALAFALNLPLLAVNHIEGHLYANCLGRDDFSFPVIGLVVSGGHTDLILIKSHGCYKLIGRTRDDAAGEVFDKVARKLGLGYPGGPIIDRLSFDGNEDAVKFPRARLEEGTFDFSFSGLKTAVANFYLKANQRGEEINLADLTASFQKAVVDALVEKTIQSAQMYGAKTILMAGGVASNRRPRLFLKQKALEKGLAVSYPSTVLCTDNAAMVGCCAYSKYLRSDFAPYSLNAIPDLKLGENT